MKKTYQILNSVQYNFEDKKLVGFTYHFNNGEKMHIDKSMLNEQEMEEMQDLARKEYNCQQREQRRKLKALGMGGNANSISDPVVSELIRRERNKRIATAFNELLPEQRDILRLIHLNGEKACEIAKRENVSNSAISKRLKRAENSLKKLLA